MNIRRFSPYGIALLLVALAFAGVVWRDSHVMKKPLISISHGHVTVNADRMEALYREVGGEALPGYVLDMTRNFSRANFHYVGHAVGDVLYNHEGLKATEMCGESFEWGCLHQIIGKAYAEHGQEMLQQLADICNAYTDEKKRGECQHGFGHGVMYAHQYATSRLDEMLQKCDEITTVRPIPKNASCHAGLMMEYNMHLMTMEYEGENGRPAEATHLFDFCTTLTKAEHQSMCVFWVVPWLHGRLFDFAYDAQTFERLGTLCEQVPGNGLRKACFQGVGRSVGINAILPAQTVVDFCKASTEEISLERTCIRSATSVYTSIGKEEAVKEICALVGDNPLLACAK